MDVQLRATGLNSAKTLARNAEQRAECDQPGRIEPEPQQDNRTCKREQHGWQVDQRRAAELHSHRCHQRE